MDGVRDVAETERERCEIPTRPLERRDEDEARPVDVHAFLRDQSLRRCEPAGRLPREPHRPTAVAEVPAPPTLAREDLDGLAGHVVHPDGQGGLSVAGPRLAGGVEGAADGLQAIVPHADSTSLRTVRARTREPSSHCSGGVNSSGE